MQRRIPRLLDQAKSGNLEWHQFGRALLEEIAPILRDWERMEVAEPAKTERKTKVLRLVDGFLEAVQAKDKQGVTNERLTNHLLDQMAKCSEDSIPNSRLTIAVS